MLARRFEPWLIGLAALLVTAVPITWQGWARSPADVAGQLAMVVAGLLLVTWRHALVTTLGGGGLVLGAACVIGTSSLDFDLPNLSLLVCTALAFVAGLGFSRRAAWTSAAAVAAWLALMYLVTGERDAGLVMFTVPGFVAGTALRMRREVADELTLRSAELEAERELFAQLAVRNERARIAAELHDIIGHSLSVMVVQAAAGQRLLQQDTVAARQAGTDVLAVVAESARQGQADLARLVELLGGQQIAAPDLELMDEVVALAAGSGLQVTCRFEGDRDGVSAQMAGIAFRVVRESLTNALRHAPGASVRVVVRGGERQLDVQVENDPPAAASVGITGTGYGLRGLRDLVEHHGGHFAAGGTGAGGWLVEASVPSLV